MPIRGLAIETSSRRGEVAALEDGRVVGMEGFASGLRHASGLIGMLRRAMGSAGWGEDAIGEVDELYVSIGPGSFTGLRVAVTLAKGVWLARRTGGQAELRVVAVPTLAAVVGNLEGEEGDEAAVVLDAKRGQVFTASYRWGGGGWMETRPARLDTLAGVVSEAGLRGVRLRLTGEGLGYHAAGAEEAVVAERVKEGLWWPRAAEVGRLGYGMGRRGLWADVMTLEPLYVRLPEAEEKWAAGCL